MPIIKTKQAFSREFFMPQKRKKIMSTKEGFIDTEKRKVSTFQHQKKLGM